MVKSIETQEIFSTEKSPGDSSPEPEFYMDALCAVQKSVIFFLERDNCDTGGHQNRCGRNTENGLAGLRN